jgi:hypothetical protein
MISGGGRFGIGYDGQQGRLHRCMARPETKAVCFASCIRPPPAGRYGGRVRRARPRCGGRNRRDRVLGSGGRMACDVLLPTLRVFLPVDVVAK